MLPESLTDVEIWILSHIAIKQAQSDPSGYGRTKATITPRHIVTVLPPSLLPNVNSVENILVSLFTLRKYGLLHDSGYGSDEDTSFTITANGILAFRKFLQPLAKAIKEGNSYKKIIAHTEGDPKTKKDLEKVLDKFKNHFEDKIVDEVIEFLKRAGPPALIYIVKLLGGN